MTKENLNKLKKQDLIKLVNIYRNELITSGKIFKDFAQNNFYKDPLHKVACACKLAHIEIITDDYTTALLFAKD